MIVPMSNVSLKTWSFIGFAGGKLPHCVAEPLAFQKLVIHLC